MAARPAARAVLIAPSALLTPKEREVLRHLAEGWSYEQCALKLEIAVSSVRTYVVRAYAKLGVHTKSEATAKLARSGLLP